jgi:hypothetical protein
MQNKPASERIQTSLQVAFHRFGVLPLLEVVDFDEIPRQDSVCRGTSCCVFFRAFVCLWFVYGLFFCEQSTQLSLSLSYLLVLVSFLQLQFSLLVYMTEVRDAIQRAADEVQGTAQMTAQHQQPPQAIKSVVEKRNADLSAELQLSGRRGSRARSSFIVRILGVVRRDLFPFLLFPPFLLSFSLSFLRPFGLSFVLSVVFFLLVLFLLFPSLVLSLACILSFFFLSICRSFLRLLFGLGRCSSTFDYLP